MDVLGGSLKKGKSSEFNSRHDGGISGASKRQETSAAAKRVYYFRNFVKMESQFRISFLDFFYFFLHDNTALYVVVLQYWAEEKI